LGLSSGFGNLTAGVSISSHRERRIARRRLGSFRALERRPTIHYNFVSNALYQPRWALGVEKMHADRNVASLLLPATYLGPVRTRYSLFETRVVDLLVACALIVFTLPLMAIVALAIKCDSPGPILYRQERVGLGGRRFMLLKFRYMAQNAEADGQPVWAVERDVRVTPVGRIIRSLRIDELPQLLSVLRGDMSMVGPRPERPYFVEKLTDRNPAVCSAAKGKAGHHRLGPD
jgi:lipopolysaccharide/colanic/teichoic acid biosynthesis glycosyltransferase